MPAVSPELQTKLAFGRAFLIHLDRGDRAMARLFAKAFVIQGLLANGLGRQTSAR
jgi:hypothetical protein